MRTVFFLFAFTLSLSAHPDHHPDPFHQLEEVLPTPTDTRTASGAPGHAYWQQRADHDIAITLDEINHTISGSQTITYTNNSPDTLRYLWLQLDRNLFTPNSPGHQTRTHSRFGDQEYERFRKLLTRETFDGGYKITSVTTKGEKLPYTISESMMRIDLPQPLSPKSQFSFQTSWSFKINDIKTLWGRTGYETFKDKNSIFQIAQFFPRMAAYTDVNGWQHKQFLGRGEFTLEFGDYRVAITTPADHIVASTGTLVNPNDVLTNTQKERLKEAQSAELPVMIVTEKEAIESSKVTSEVASKTWIFEANNVRDFAFASSRKFIWDAVQHTLPNSDQKVWAMSYYPKEAQPLWQKYSTASVVHTLNVYSRHTFDYPYPVAISVHGKIFGMEYPMISFNGARPEDDGTYDEKTKKALISVIIHEVGHNWFPMIINSDERQWTWMDEGLNSFLQSVAEEEWDAEPYNVPSLPESITGYMKGGRQRPIMTNSEAILQFGNNAYNKPASALTVLRETIMGRELFDFAFKEYANRWRFKRPQPSDFFRSMEDASAMDLDWFWRGWFYTTKHVDLALSDVTLYELDTEDPVSTKAREKKDHSEEEARNLTHNRNSDLKKFTTGREDLKDFYTTYDPFEVTDKETEEYAKKLKELEAQDRNLLDTKKHFTQVHIKNVGGLVSPVLLEATFEDKSTRLYRIPAEIWRKSPQSIKRLLITDSPISQLVIDPQRETADVDHENNTWPPKPKTKHFKLKPKEKKENSIRDSLEKEAKKKKEKAKKAEEKKDKASE